MLLFPTVAMQLVCLNNWLFVKFYSVIIRLIVDKWIFIKHKIKYIVNVCLLQILFFGSDGNFETILSCNLMIF